MVNTEEIRKRKAACKAALRAWLVPGATQDNLGGRNSLGQTEAEVAEHIEIAAIVDPAQHELSSTIVPAINMDFSEERLQSCNSPIEISEDEAPQDRIYDHDLSKRNMRDPD